MESEGQNSSPARRKANKMALGIAMGIALGVAMGAGIGTVLRGQQDRKE